MTAAVLASTIPAHAAMGMALISEPGLPPLEWQRTVLVVGHDAELAVALRDRVDRAFLTVCEVRPDEAPAAVQASRPWPWMVVGDTDDLAEPFAQALRSLPSLLLWRFPPPRGLPSHLRVVQRFSELAGAIDSGLRAEVCGIRLAVGSGLTMPDGSHVSSPVLEALVANHPRPVCVSPRQLRAASAALSTHRMPFRARQGDGGAVLVVPAS